MRTQIPVVVIVINFSPEVKLPPTPFSWISSRLAHHSPFPRFLHHFIRHLILLRLEGNTKTNPSHATNVTNVTFLQTTPTGSGGAGLCTVVTYPPPILLIIIYSLVSVLLSLPLTTGEPSSGHSLKLYIGGIQD